MVCPVGVAMLATGGQVLAVVGNIKARGGLHERTQSGICPFTVSLYFLKKRTILPLIGPFPILCFT